MFNVAVIGCGVIGLPTALAIQNSLRSKAKVVIFTDQVSPNTTGDIAAGLWTPYLLGNTPPEKVTKWAKHTQDYILKLWKQGCAKEAGISLQLIMTLSDSENFTVPEWLNITLGYTVMSQEKLKYYGDIYKETFTGGYAFVSFIWEASKFLPFLEKQFLLNGGEIKMKKVENFEDLSDFDVIANCTGLNAKILAGDVSVEPIRGQITRVDAPWQFNTLMLHTKKGSYIIPNQNTVILGGTSQIGDYNIQVDENDKQKILNSCYKYVPSLRSAAIIKHSVGLRPGRSEIRLEIENRKTKNKILKIVHNYGHGGSGITVSMGCAEAAAELVREALGVCGLSKL